MEIIRKIIGWNTHDNNPNALLWGGKPKGITVHQTGNFAKGADAEMHSRYQLNDSGADAASWSYEVDDKVIIQNFEDDRATWHGSTSEANFTTISVEICVNHADNKELYLKALRNAAWLIATKIKKYNWTLKNVYQHYDWIGKDCPQQIRQGLHGVNWTKFQGMITEELNKINNVTSGPVLKIENTLSKVAKKYLGTDGKASKTYATGSNVNDDWCVYFVDMILNEVYGTDIKVGWVDEIAELMEPISKPEKNCIVVFDTNWNDYGDHIGICSYTDGQYVTVIEGNTKSDDNMKSIVSENTYSINGEIKFSFYKVPDSLKSTNVKIVGKPMKIIIEENTNVYRSVEDVQNNRNPIVYKPGEYTIYRTYNEYVNISKTSNPGGWVKLKGVK